MPPSIAWQHFDRAAIASSCKAPSGSLPSFSNESRGSSLLLPLRQQHVQVALRVRREEEIERGWQRRLRKTRKGIAPHKPPLVTDPRATWQLLRTRQRASAGKSKPSGCNRKTVRHPPTNESLGHSNRTNLEHPFQSNLALKLRGMRRPSLICSCGMHHLEIMDRPRLPLRPMRHGVMLTFQKAFRAQIKVAGAAAPHELLLREGGPCSRSKTSRAGRSRSEPKGDPWGTLLGHTAYQAKPEHPLQALHCC